MCADTCNLYTARYLKVHVNWVRDGRGGGRGVIIDAGRNNLFVYV